MPKRSKSSERWLQRQRKDYFVRKAQDGGQVSRAHYKLAQIDERFNILSARKRV
jgi:23S rRNA (uridine2552-2'-O)-methyltransferase